MIKAQGYPPAGSSKHFGTGRSNLKISSVAMKKSRKTKAYILFKDCIKHWVESQRK